MRWRGRPLRLPVSAVESSDVDERHAEAVDAIVALGVQSMIFSADAAAQDNLFSAADLTCPVLLQDNSPPSEVASPSPLLEDWPV